MQSAPVTFPRIQTACMNFSQSHISANVTRPKHNLPQSKDTSEDFIKSLFMCTITQDFHSFSEKLHGSVL